VDLWIGMTEAQKQAIWQRIETADTIRNRRDAGSAHN
jgi:predicted Fe-S protein YdhL (DUF1289 family)